MTDFDAETAMNVGGWDRRYARVLDVQVDGDVADALVDANGDRSDINTDIYVRSPAGEWREVVSGNQRLGDTRLASFIRRRPAACADPDHERLAA